MNIMKFVGVIILTIGFFQCKSAQFDKTPPFTIVSATYKTDNNTNTLVSVEFIASQNIVFNVIYFQDKKAKGTVQKSENKTFMKAYFNASMAAITNDLLLDSDSKKEFGNKLPLKNSQFNLNKNEAVLSYTERGKIHYFKIKNLKEAE